MRCIIFKFKKKSKKVEKQSRFEIDYLPVGTVVVLKDRISKLIVVTSFQVEAYDTPGLYFDYGGADYPLGGVTEGAVFGFNRSSIGKVVHMGYENEQWEVMKQETYRLTRADAVKAAREFWGGTET